MVDVKHKVERAAFGAAIDGILKYVNKDEADREKALRNSADNLKKYLETMMLEVDKKKFKTKLFSFNIQKNAPSVKVEVEELLPKKYLIPQPDKVDKKQLLKDLKAGVIEANENMRLVQTESLRIR